MSMLVRTRWDLAESMANELTEDITSPPIPVYEIAESNGVNVVFVDFGEHSEKVAGLCDFKNARIYVNKDDSVERQTFTIAHELGHWMLHEDRFHEDPDAVPILPRFSKTDNRNPLEKEANKFATHLLVPERLLLPVKEASVAALARIFGVSRLLMECRLRNV